MRWPHSIRVRECETRSDRQSTMRSHTWRTVSSAAPARYRTTSPPLAGGRRSVASKSTSAPESRSKCAVAWPSPTRYRQEMHGGRASSAASHIAETTSSTPSTRSRRPCDAETSAFSFRGAAAPPKRPTTLWALDATASVSDDAAPSSSRAAAASTARASATARAPSLFESSARAGKSSSRSPASSHAILPRGSAADSGAGYGASRRRAPDEVEDSATNRAASSETSDAQSSPRKSSMTHATPRP
mmetsp:Transcript_16905/g.57872  ORF Transcript_16905/g.57872 Transcript_16905/m.57872 type:complete len:245 (+) Transcript_16905:50-784(+)